VDKKSHFISNKNKSWMVYAKYFLKINKSSGLQRKHPLPPPTVFCMGRGCGGSFHSIAVS
jgi:hypothetical protein